MTRAQMMASTALTDGVWLHLDEAPYFAQKRQGSTDITNLHLKKEGAWWSSPLNPYYRPEPEDDGARIFGKALHALVLEGDAAYAQRFATIPSKSQLAAQYGWAKEGGRFCVTVPDMEAALERRQMFPKRMKKEELIPYVRSRAPDLIIWDVFEADWKKENARKLPVTEEEDYQLQLMARLVREHREVGEFFRFDEAHKPLVEVSILWTEAHGVREMMRRARLDAFWPQQTVDVKALTNIGMRPLSFAVGDHLGKFGYHVQAADHHVARRRAYKFIQEGRIFDGTPEDERTKESVERFEEHKAWLMRYPEHAPNWEYLWLFFQRPDSRTGKAPIILPWQEDYGSELHMDGIRGRRNAIQTYLQCMAQFGENEPWTRVEPVYTSRDGATNRVFLPAHISLPSQPGEEEDL